MTNYNLIIINLTQTYIHFNLKAYLVIKVHKFWYWIKYMDIYIILKMSQILTSLSRTKLFICFFRMMKSRSWMKCWQRLEKHSRPKKRRLQTFSRSCQRTSYTTRKRWVIVSQQLDHVLTQYYRTFICRSSCVYGYPYKGIVYDWIAVLWR